MNNTPAKGCRGFGAVYAFRCLTKGERDERLVVLRPTDVNASIDGTLSVGIDTRCHARTHCANLESHRKLCQRTLEG